MASQPSNNGLNPWSNGRVIKIPVYDSDFKPREVTWRGKTIEVMDYELFTMFVRGIMESAGWSKEKALDEFFFEMDC